MHAHPVASVLFCFVQGFIGTGNQCLLAISALRIGGNADADGDVHGLIAALRYLCPFLARAGLASDREPGFGDRLA